MPSWTKVKSLIPGWCYALGKSDPYGDREYDVRDAMNYDGERKILPVGARAVGKGRATAVAKGYNGHGRVPPNLIAKEETMSLCSP